MDENKTTIETEEPQETQKPKENKKKAKADERVEVFVPRGRDKGDSELLICINGKNYVLPRGKKSLVPPEVAAEYERSVKAEDVWFDKKASMQSEG